VLFLDFSGVWRTAAPASRDRDEKHDTTQKSVNNVQRLSSYVNNAARGL
jgi:hypothetical protein